MPISLRLSPRISGMLAALVTVLIWSAFIVIARASADPARDASLLPWDIALARLIGAGLVLLPLGLWLSQRDRAAGRPPGSLMGLSPLPWRETCVAGLFGGLLYALLAYSGFVYAPAAHASVLMPGSLPLWTALLALVILGTRITAARAFGLLLIVLGGLAVGGPSLLQGFAGNDVWKGDLLFVAAAVCWSTYSVLARRFRLDAVRGTVAITAFACVVFIPTYLLALAAGWVEGRFFQAPVRDVLWQVLFQGVLSVAVSGITFTRMIEHYGPVRSTMLTSVVPGLSALGAWALLGEPLGVNQWLGLALVTVGIVFGVRSSSAVAPPAPAAAPGRL